MKHAYLVALALVLSGCSVTQPSAQPETPTDSPGDSKVAGETAGPVLDVAWTDASGRELPDGDPPDEGFVINTQPGPAHCGWQSAVIMLVAFPFGPEPSERSIRQYLRDPDGALPPVGVTGNFEPNATLPDDAEPTGLYNGDTDLWTAPSTADRFVYVGNDDGFEAWPRVDPPRGCD